MRLLFNWSTKILQYISKYFCFVHYFCLLKCKLVWCHSAIHRSCPLFTILVTQDKRITVVDALAHPYLDEGRLRYHSCMCTCCYTTSAGMRQYRVDFEPSAAHPFDDLWERKLTSVQQVKGKKYSRIPIDISKIWNEKNKCRVAWSICVLFRAIFRW